MLFCELEKDDYVAETAAANRKEGKCLKDGMPRPHQPSDLEPEKFKTPCKLNEFLTYLLTVKGENEISSQSAATFSRSINSLHRHQWESENSKKFITTKCHQNTNNTKVVNILHGLGHGVSYSILSEMHTENAFFILKQQSDEVILPINTAIEAFTICVLDNDDRNKET